MLSTYVKIACRSLLNRPMFSLLNLSGLVVGMVACLLIAQFVRYEWSYDRQSPHAAHIWRAFNETVTEGKVVTQDANTHSILGPSLLRDLPGEVTDFTRLFNHGEPQITLFHNGQPTPLDGAWMADPGFLRMFPQRFLAGREVGCLDAPFTVILTESAAVQLFGAAEKAVGQSLRVPGGYFAGHYMVNAVVADPPYNTHLKFKALASYETRHALGHEDNWSDYWEYTYFQLALGTDPQRVQAKLAEYSEQHLKREGIRLAMQPLTDIHLYSRLTYEIEPNGSARTVRFLALVAAFVLLIAFVNYINLTTARSMSRAKEVALRKVVGARRGQLVGQFLLEGSLLNGAAVVVAVGLVQAVLPVFAHLTDRPLASVPGFDATFWLTVAGLWAAGVVAACLYPAVAMSGFSPMAALSGRFFKKRDNATMRKGLVVLQFACSTALIVAVLVVWRQLDFLEKHDKGLSLEQVVALKTPGLDWRRDSLNRRDMGFLKNEIARLSGVESVAVSSVVPSLGISTISGTNSGMQWVKKPEAASRATVYFLNTEQAFFPTYGIRFLAGQPYEAPNRRAAYQHVVINDACRRMLGFSTPQEAVGEEIAFAGNAESRLRVHGVVADFHIESLKEPTRPTLYYCSPEMTQGYISIKLDTRQAQPILAEAERIWRQTFPESVFEPQFVDERFAAQYRSERQLGKVFGGFALLAIFVACLGLFGLAAFTAEQRTKEVGIRKVLGASVTGIVALLSRDFLRLVVGSFVLAMPAAYFLMQKWLADFAYRIDLQAWMFAVAGLTAVLAALLTVGAQSIRAALANPTESLRREL